MHECRQEGVIGIVLAKLTVIEADVKTLLLHKAKIAGMITMAMGIGTACGWIFSFLFTHFFTK